MRKFSLLFFSCTLLLLSCQSEDKARQATGVFEAVEVIVSSEATGKLLKFQVEEGQPISMKTIVGQIDTVQLSLKKTQLKANQLAITSNQPDINSQIRATQREIEKLQVERERTQRLLEGDVATQKQLDDIQAQLDVLNARLSAQKTSLRSHSDVLDAQANAIAIQIEQVEDQMARCEIQSPIDGTVLVKYVESGEFVNMGKPLFKVANMEKMVLKAYVTASQLKDLVLNQEVRVDSEFGANESKVYQGRITHISDKSEFTPKTIQTQDERANLVYAVKVAVENDGFLKIGMYATINWAAE